MLEQLQNLVVLSLLRLPEPIVSLLAGSPIVIDGQKLDPRLQLLLRLMALSGAPEINELPVPDGRALYRQLGPAFGGTPPGMERVADRGIPGPAGEIPVRIYTPKTTEQPLPVLVFFHGGGWVIGDLDTHDGPCRLLADRVGCVVVAVHYRLAPEHKFPAAVDDAFAAWQWVTGHAGELGGDPTRVAVGGDSAGGNLAAIVSQLARDGGGPSPVLQLLVYPVTDMSVERPSYEKFADGFFLTRDLMRWFRDHYLSTHEERTDPRFSPLLGNLADLPPVFLSTAGFDPLRDEGQEYATRLEAAGVEVTSKNHAELIHGWFSMTGVFPAAARAFDDHVAALRGAFGRQRAAA